MDLLTYSSCQVYICKNSRSCNIVVSIIIIVVVIVSTYMVVNFCDWSRSNGIVFISIVGVVCTCINIIFISRYNTSNRTYRG